MRSHVFGRSLALFLSMGLVVGLSACGDNALPSSGQGGTDQSLSGEFAGSGASSQQSANEAWIAGFRQNHPQARISYDPSGSGAGVNAFLNGSTIWAGSDAPLSKSQIRQSEAICQDGTAFDLPVYATPIAVAYNLGDAGLNGPDRHLNMTPETIARIFSGKITNWKDPELARLNPGATLPDLPITVVHRSDKSGTTKSFVSYLHDAAGSAWPYAVGENWPNDLGQSAKGTAGVVMTMTQAQGTIGYADAAQTTSLGSVAVKVGNGWTPPSAKAAALVLDSARPSPDAVEPNRVVLDIDHTTDQAGAYPIMLISYDVACSVYRHDQDRSKARFAKAWLTYIVSEEGQRQAAANAGSAELSEAVRARVMASVKKIEVD
ncbi:phosphate ABC transporter substrate-binding protein PstS [Bifidobacterium coryneforme]|uniref:phosphate ABC transporter substrate-binding protein PstS n=1 Tax=Bifidobacterium coryneforme TaxID=1687 RepID=UPI0004E5DDDF|nr:phosphate ABC transporter substrate-binding protein PstS [Bifidobacterium coryneforme]AII74333.1 phosphate ABC transporter, phosphate-binding protein PstS [Bifidobacterium coryneforme]MCT6837365.1 phosphate ABC transporter substrate-binding protein PstS [Bifidobacteriales bacterium]